MISYLDNLSRYRLYSNTRCKWGLSVAGGKKKQGGDGLNSTGRNGKQQVTGLLGDVGGSGFPGHAQRQGPWATRDYHLPTQGNGNPQSKRNASLFTILLEVFKIFLFCPILRVGELS